MVPSCSSRSLQCCTTPIADFLLFTLGAPSPSAPRPYLPRAAEVTGAVVDDLQLCMVGHVRQQYVLRLQVTCRERAGGHTGVRQVDMAVEPNRRCAAAARCQGGSMP
jgi:hypothetical protein